jgi:YD repeat-containing protein
MLDGVVDLVTGMPMLSTTDLTLPFGGAEFRLTRTWSYERGNRDNMFDACGTKPKFRNWSWAGEGWMLGENPILMVDSAMLETEGDQPRTTRLILDAHRSIPFQLIETTGQYEAPPRFRAILTHNGRWSNESPRGWATAPTVYRVSLYENSVTYTFVVVPIANIPKRWFPQFWETADGPKGSPDDTGNFHKRPYTPTQLLAAGLTEADQRMRATAADVSDMREQPGLGIPHIGLCVGIEDQHGHMVEIQHCSVQSRPMDLNASPDCVECFQECQALGQINWVRLWAPNAGGGHKVEWTLLYLHRRIPRTIPVTTSGAVLDTWENPYYAISAQPEQPEADPSTGITNPIARNLLDPDKGPLTLEESRGETVLDRIYVYEGNFFSGSDGRPSSPPTCATLRWTDNLDPMASDSEGNGGVTTYEPDADRTYVRRLRANATGQTVGDEPVTSPLSTFYNDPPPMVSVAAHKWRHMIRYHYDLIGRSLSNPYYYSDAQQQLYTTPLLLRISVSSRTQSTIAPLDNSPIPSSTKSTVFRYTRIDLQSQHWITAAWSDDDLRRIQSARFTSSTGTLTPLPTVAEIAMNGVRSNFDPSTLAPSGFQWRRLSDSGYSAPQPGTSIESLESPSDGDTIWTDDTIENWLLRQASIYLTPRLACNGSSSSSELAPAWCGVSDSPSLLSLAASTTPYVSLGNHPNGTQKVAAIDAGEEVASKTIPEITVGAARLRQGNEDFKHYRIQRLVVLPPSSQVPPITGPFAAEGRNTGVPMGPSILLHPYAWTRSTKSLSDISKLGDLSQPADLMHERWIAIVDEFPQLRDGVIAELDNAAYSESSGLMPEQTARRVVYLNAAGYVLRQANWEFNGAAAPVATYSGLGDENIYSKVGTLLGWTPAMPNTPANPGFNGGTLGPPTALGTAAEYAATEELVRIQHRSVGWSAARNAGTGQGLGLITYFSYQRFDAGMRWVNDGQQDRQEPIIPWSEQVQLVETGVKKGTTGAEYPTRRWFRDPNWPHEVTAEVAWNTSEGTAGSLPMVGSDAPQSGVDGNSSISVTRNITLPISTPRASAASPRRVEWRITLGPGRKLRPGSPLYFPVQAARYDDRGRQQWGFQGLVLGIQGGMPTLVSPAGSPEAAQLTYLVPTYYSYDESARGRLQMVVADTREGASLGPMMSAPSPTPPPVPAVPDGWLKTSLAAPLNQRTEYAYSGEGEVSDILYPTGLRWSRRVVKMPMDGMKPEDWPAREFVFNDLRLTAPIGSQQNVITSVVVNDTNQQFVTMSPGAINDFSGPKAVGSPGFGRSVEFPSQFSLQSVLDEAGSTALGNGPKLPYYGNNNGSATGGQTTFDNFRIMQGVKLAPDSNGRLAKAELLEPDSTGAMVSVGSKTINDLGEVVRSQEIDGTITRTTRCPRGLPLRTYVGTDDANWLTAIVSDFKLALTERMSYGRGIHDALLPVARRQYMSNPHWATDSSKYYDSPDGVNPQGFADEFGIAAITSYDWRMRPVRVDRFDEPARSTTENPNPPPPARLESTITYLDHADRPYLVAMFGRGTLPSAVQAGGALDPSRPSADALLRVMPGDVLSAAASSGTASDQRAKLISLVETVYGPDGGVEERRIYDTGSASPTAMIERTYFGPGGQEVYSQRPGEPVRITEYDGVGRPHRVRVVDPVSPFNYELTRTDTVFNGFGDAIETINWERISSSSTGNTLDTSNAVATRKWNWYDDKRQLLATVDLGTSDAQGYFINGSPATNPNRTGLIDPPGLARVGNLWALPGAAPAALSGIPDHARVWLTTYDSSGREVHRAERNSEPDGSLLRPDGSSSRWRVTESRYDRVGRLTDELEYLPDALGTAWWGAGREARRTHYRYLYGRLSEMGTLRESVTASTPLPSLSHHGRRQLTRIGFKSSVAGEPGSAAEIVNDSFEAVSANNGMIGEVYTFKPAEAWHPLSIPRRDLLLRYDFSGRIAERVDAALRAFRYRYDALGRLVSIEVGHYLNQGQAELGGGSFNPGPRNSSGAEPGRFWHVFRGDEVGFISYSYGSDGRLAEAKTFSSRASAADEGAIPLSHVRLRYDAAGNLEGDDQAIRSLIPPSSAGTDIPGVRYTWDRQTVAPGTIAAFVGRNRLMGYNLAEPAARRPGPDPQVPNLAMTFDYGVVNSLDDRIDRLRKIKRADAVLAEFEYSGVSRRIFTGLGAGAIRERLDIDPEAVGLEGLDRFGRRHHLLIEGRTNTDSLWTKLVDRRSGYDAAGNRLWTDVADPESGSASDEQLIYDRFDRLIEHHKGTLNQSSPVPAANPAITVSPTVPYRDRWNLDLVGNWGLHLDPTVRLCPPEQETCPDFEAKIGRITDRAGNGFTWVNYPANTRNEINPLAIFNGDWTPEGGSAYPAGLNPDWVYDAAGNLRYDGQFYYVYDSWNRLIQVDRVIWVMPGSGGGAAAAAAIASGPGAGESGPDIDPLAELAATDPELAELIAQAQGQLTASQPTGPPASPNGQAPLNAIGLSSGSGSLPTEYVPDRSWLRSYFYDGLGRLIATRGPNPGPEYSWQSYHPLDKPEQGGTFFGEVIEERYIYDGARRVQETRQTGRTRVCNKVTTTQFEGQLSTGFVDVCAFEPYAANPPTLTRRYLWGPGDEGSQELLAYYDAAAIAADNGQPRWVLQDLNHDVIGIADIVGNVPRVVARFSYDAYGRVLSAVAPPVGVPPAPAPPPPLSVGHHGLFAEDADTNLADLTHGPNTNWWVAGVGSPLSPDTQNLLYLTPNRVLSPKLGRWLQADPNQTAQAVLGSITFGGMPLGASVANFDLKGRFGDGVNLYQYVRSNPYSGGDPTGLARDPFELHVDDYLAEDAGNKAAFMGSLVKGFNTTAYLAGQVAQLHPVVGGAAALYRIGTGQGSIWDALSAAPLLGKAMGFFSSRASAMSASGRGGFGVGTATATTAGSGRYSVLELLGTVKLTDASGTVSIHGIKSGGYAAALDDLNRLAKPGTVQKSGTSVIGTLDDGSTLAVYQKSTSTGYPSLQIQQVIPGTSNASGHSIKIRYEP